MKKLSLVIVFLFAVFFVPQVKAEIVSQLITEKIEIPSPGGTAGRVFFHKNIVLDYQGGKVVISGKPDGTGDIFIDDMLQIIRNNSVLTFTTYYEAFGRDCDNLKREIGSTDITSFLQPGINQLLIRFSEWCSSSTNTIGPLYVMYDKPDVVPFLDLPWDYRGKGMSFNVAATSMFSYFDHTYPLLSAGLLEPTSYAEQITAYTPLVLQDSPYSKHDGYDYAYKSGIRIGDPVLAAADGIATYIGYYGGCGHTIVIDHQNGYQTRYCHLENDSDDDYIITKAIGETIQVFRGQQIGVVGMSGNTDGLHIHFMVVKDKNKDGKFNDNIPDGVTDPYGWDSTEPDPWENYTFTYLGQAKTGNKSHYLWRNKLDSYKNSFISILAGQKIAVGKCVLEFTNGMTGGITAEIKEVPSKSHPTQKNIGTTYDITFRRTNGELISTFNSPIKLTLDFNSADLSRILPGTLSIYSSPNGISWTKEQTVVDFVTKKAIAQVGHFSQFVLMAEKLDSIAPTTMAQIDQAIDKIATLISTDNEGGSGIAYTLYKLDDADWQEYKEPITISEDGYHRIEFFSADQDGNVEEHKNVEFDVAHDTVPPEAEIVFDTNLLDLQIRGIDDSGEARVSEEFIDSLHKKIIVLDKFSNKLVISLSEIEKGKSSKLKIESLAYNNEMPVVLDQNRFTVRYNFDNTNQTLRTIDERFEIEGILKVRLEYSARTNTTKVITLENGSERVKEELPGLKHLQLYTEKGSLKYNY